MDAIGNWLTNRTSFNRLFTNNSDINSSDMANWDNFSNITTFNLLFYNATAFNVNIGSWNIASVTTLLDVLVTLILLIKILDLGTLVLQLLYPDVP